MADHRSKAELAEDNYFTVNAPPKSLQNHATLAKAFIERHLSEGRRVVLVTSGGTTVPLENQTVRFIDNFSNGTRGATSAEYFLEAGYAVIFLHRQFSLLPYSRHYSHSTNCFLDFMTESGEEGGEEGGENNNSKDGGKVLVNEEYQSQMLSVLRKYRKAKRNNMLLLLPFTTITDYLWELREIAKLMQPLRSAGLFYLAAAVSDFFVPQDRMPEHKIQSSEQNKPPLHTHAAGSGSGDAAGADSQQDDEQCLAQGQSKKLIVDLDPVPKFLKRLVDGWAPESMIVSFKLETDPTILVHKARQALDRYAHHLVIGNLLSTRKWEVVFVARNAENAWIRVPRHRRKKSISGREAEIGLAEHVNGSVVTPDSTDDTGIDREVEIESLIVPEVARRHAERISNAEK
ncbi:phosphopantothenate-cysteine ligase-like protein [Xylona heveae TC161]|uniref:Phosphopantothenate-cysteine ligase-like protein n=1 Tax=Xylona heveae (strain CBS 132557 / TC161) TaxID=1328760 RepID=A0A165JY47_XYLHT|nr:phosphopantothenate-cysteine ligase-like protein [Xylona heveae TC161]KZF26772.1 phosphopantothenate-cysteine ligase-like protein [Xylona heveae TC161]